MSRNIVIIGASGTIGSSLVNIYKKNSDNQVYAFSRGYNYQRDANLIMDDIDILDEESIQKININTFAPALIFKHFFNSISRERKSVFAAFSARVGSISDNKIGGWHSYRASKSALNMIIKNFSIEISRKYKNNIIVGLHPGTVDSKLSKPFQKNVPTEKLFSGEYSALKIVKVLDSLSIQDTGKCFDFNSLEVFP